jgi:hypothetical protein
MTQANPEILGFEQRDGIGYVRLTRPAKHNALSDRLVQELQACFEQLPEAVKAVVLDGEGQHALPRIAGQPMTEGFLTEALMAAISSGAPETKQRLKDFLEKRAGKVKE